MECDKRASRWRFKEPLQTQRAGRSFTEESLSSMLSLKNRTWLTYQRGDLFQEVLSLLSRHQKRNVPLLAPELEELHSLCVIVLNDFSFFSYLVVFFFFSFLNTVSDEAVMPASIKHAAAPSAVPKKKKKCTRRGWVVLKSREV